MTVWAVSMVRDEADIIGHVVGHLLAEGVDGMIVADNNSVDGTRDLLADLAAADRRVTVVDDPDPAHWQGRKTTALAHRAGRAGADWIVPFDADELWYSPHGHLAEVLAACTAGVVEADTLEQVPRPGDDPADTNPVTRIGHRRPDPKAWRKVCFRYRPDIRLWEGNHRVDHPGPVGGEGLVRIREFQYRTLAQTARKVRQGKAALEAAAGLPDGEGVHWRQLGALTDAELAVWWAGHLAGDAVYDPAPVRCPR